MRLEVLFYAIAYELEVFEDAIDRITELLNAGVRVTTWDLSYELAAARSSRHPCSDLLAQVVTAKQR
jgi:hypothetical protein